MKVDVDLLQKEIPSQKETVDKIVGSHQNPFTIARTVETFFRSNFQYTLDVNFKGDEKGILQMIKKRKPAYCSFFASAITVARVMPIRILL